MKRLALTILMGLLAGPVAGAEAPQRFAIDAAPKPLPEVQFVDGDGRPRALADFRGRMVLLNIWATWCAPCRREMPTLDRLQAELGGPDFEVVALSLDRAGSGVVRTFYDEVGVKHLALYTDSSGRAARELHARGLPTTLLIDRAGRELGRLVGPAEWDTAEMVAFIRSHLADQHGAPAATENEHPTRDLHKESAGSPRISPSIREGTGS